MSLISRLPPSAEPWYDERLGEEGASSFAAVGPGGRRSLARFALNGGVGAHDIGELADFDPDALAPWADAVLAFDDEALVRLNEQGARGWRGGRGASDAAVSALAARIWSDLPGAECREWMPPLLRVELLIGADTPCSLAHLGELARASPAVARACEEHALVVPPRGAAERRFAAKARRLLGFRASAVARMDGALPEQLPAHSGRSLPPPEEVLLDPRGTACAAPLAVALDLGLGLIPEAPQAAGRVLALSSLCEACDEWSNGYRWLSVGGKAAVVETLDEHGRPADVDEAAEACPGHAVDPSEPLCLAIVDDTYDAVEAGLRRWSPQARWRLGGPPDWLQPQRPIPRCCDRPMFYVAHVCAADAGGPGSCHYLFVCECGAGAQTVQFT